MISSQEELQSIYPDYIEIFPDIDFSKNCIVVTINEAEEGWTAVGQFYPYGVYRMPYNGEAISLQKIKPYITFCDSMQQIYRDCLIEYIQKGELSKVIDK